MKLAVIPARGGSKRIPRKNILPFAGKPMIEWSIIAAQESNCFDRVIVSTDDSDIADIALACNADVPFMRPAELSDDYTTTIPVIAHAIEWQNANGLQVDMACCIYATAPFITADSLRQGLDILADSKANYAFSVSTFAFPIQRAIRIKNDGFVEMFNPSQSETRSQDLEEAWHDAGQFYWGRAEAWLKQIAIFNSLAAPVILPRHRVQDIDTIEDWHRAELMHSAMTKV